MSWLAILLALAGMGGVPATKAERVTKPCAKAATKKACKPATNPKKKPKKPVTRGKKPAPTPTPAPETGAGGGAPPAATRPEATPTPTATVPKPLAPVATATPTPTATPVAYPRRTAVDLVEWDVRSSYHTLGAGRVTFNVNNLGEDDHDLTVRAGGGPALGKLELMPGQTGPLQLELAAGSYILYCSLPNHEAAGMKATISVR